MDAIPSPGGAPTAGPPKLPPDPRRRLVEVVSHALWSDLDRMVRHEPGTLEGKDDEALHQMRVATRRLRAVLRIFRPLLDREWADALRQQLQTTARVLGDVRDLDVLLQRLAEEPAEGPAVAGIDELRALMMRRRTVRRVRMCAVLEDPAHATLMAELAQAARAPRCLDPDGPAGPQLAPLVSTAWKRVRKAQRSSSTHKVRIRIKQLRYAADAAQPAFGKPARRLAKVAGVAQDVLGQHQDALVARDAFLEVLVTQPISREAAYAVGLLVSRNDLAMTAALEEWPAAWAALKDPKLRRFLTRNDAG